MASTDFGLADALEDLDRRKVEAALAMGAEPGAALAGLAGDDRTEAALECAKALLDGGADPNRGLPLSEALRFGRFGLALELLARGARPCMEAVCLAAEAAEEAVLGELLARGGDARGRDAGGRPLAVSIADHPFAGRTLALLVHHGADPESVDEDGWTPLCQAARSGNLEAVKALLGLGADPNGEGPCGLSALALALGARAPGYGSGPPNVGQAHVQCAAALLAAGARAGQDAGGFAPLTRLWMSMRSFVEPWFDLLASKGADPNSKSLGGWGLLRAAAAGPEPEALKLARWALERGADPLEEDAGGRQPREAAKKAGSEALAALLLSAAESRAFSAEGFLPEGSEGSSGRL